MVRRQVRNITEKAMADKSPFRWHQEKRHAPTPSAVCRRTLKDKRQSNQNLDATKPLQTFGHNRRLHVGPVQFSTTTAAEQRQYVVKPDEGLSLPFHGFTWGGLGYGACPCGVPDGRGTCKLTEATCAQANSSSSSGDCLWTLCQRQQQQQSSQAAASIPPETIWECLAQVKRPVRCEELGPSDSWGLFPMDCTKQRCLSAQAWASNAYQDVTLEGMRFVTEGRSGLKLSNYQHVNDTFHTAVNYGAQAAAASHFGQAYCFEAGATTLDDDDVHDTAVDDFVSTLFPAIQLLHESPVIASCSRFVVETARAQTLETVAQNPERAFGAREQAASWKLKCHAKLRHLGSCGMLGLYYDVPPPAAWPSLLSEHCVELQNVDAAEWGQTAYITPWCVAVHRVRCFFFCLFCFCFSFLFCEQAGAEDHVRCPAVFACGHESHRASDDDRARTPNASATEAGGLEGRGVPAGAHASAAGLFAAGIACGAAGHGVHHGRTAAGRGWHAAVFGVERADGGGVSCAAQGRRGAHQPSVGLVAGGHGADAARVPCDGDGDAPGARDV